MHTFVSEALSMIVVLFSNGNFCFYTALCLFYGLNDCLFLFILHLALLLFLSFQYLSYHYN